MAYNKAERSDSPMKRRGGVRRRKKVCVFCGKDNVIDYKDVNKLKRYVSERDPSQKDHRKLRKASESADRCHQACASSGSYALRGRINKGSGLCAFSLHVMTGAGCGCARLF